MLWGITPESWAQLWSGVIGSFIAAVVGGLVALMVVRLTNAHQSKLARDARQRAAAADMSAAIYAATQSPMLMADDAAVTLFAHIEAVHAAATRWRMDAENDELASELSKWPYHVSQLAMRASMASRASGSRIGEISFNSLAKAVGTFGSFAVEWQRSSAKEKVQLLDTLRSVRAAGEESLAETLSGAPGQAPN